jgi:O-antigen/teichoic acid export membrane protein
MGDGGKKGGSVRRDGAETVISGIAGQVTLVVSGVLVARLLGAEERGHLALLTLFPLILGFLAPLGLPAAATYYIAQGHSGRAVLRVLARPGALQVAGLVLVHAAILALVFGSEDAELQRAAAATLIGVPGWAAWVWGLAIFQGQHRFREYNLFRLLHPVIYALGAAAVFLADAPHVDLVALIWSVALVLVGFLTLWLAVRALPSAGDAPPERDTMYRFGLKSWVGSVSPVESFQLDQLAIGLLLTASDLGLYVVAFAFTNLTRVFIPQSLGSVAYPHVAAAPDRQAARRAVWRFFLAALAICGAAVLVLEATIGWLIPTFFGDEFSEAVPLARILLVGSLFLGLRRVLSDGTRGAGHPGLGTIAEGVTAAIAVPALAIGVGYGVEGVSWALTACYAVGLAALVAMALRALAREAPDVEPADPDTDVDAARELAAAGPG